MKILPKHITVDDLPPEVAEIVERAQLLLDRAYDGCAEAIHQVHASIDLHSEAHLAAKNAKDSLKGYATQRQLYVALGIVAIVFFFVGYNVHG